MTPGSDSDAGADVLLDLGPERAPGGGEGDGDGDDAVVVDPGALGHAEVDDVAAELGIDDAAQQPHDVVGGRRGARGRSVTAERDAV